MNSKGLKKRLSALLTAAACAVGLIGGSGGAFFNAQISAVAADDVATESSQELAPGEYVAALYRNSIYNANLKSGSATNKFYGQAILTVTDDNKQYLTIGVQNWSFYDAFITLNQEYNDVIVSTSLFLTGE